MDGSIRHNVSHLYKLFIIHYLLYCCVPASRPSECIRYPLNSFGGKYVDGRRSFPRALSRCCYKQRLSESLSPAVKLCGRASICDPFSDYSEFLYIILWFIKVPLFLKSRHYLRVRECACVSVCRSVVSCAFDISNISIHISFRRRNNI